MRASFLIRAEVKDLILERLQSSKFKKISHVSLHNPNIQFL